MTDKKKTTDNPKGEKPGKGRETEASQTIIPKKKALTKKRRSESGPKKDSAKAKNPSVAKRGIKKVKEFYVITPKILKKVELLAAKGCYAKDICVSIGWGKTKFYKELENNKDLANALKRGQSKRVVKLISNIAKMSDGYKFKEKHIEDIVDKETGLILRQKVKTIIKHMPPNVAANIFAVINLDGENWSNKQELTHKGDIIIKTDSDDEGL